MLLHPGVAFSLDHGSTAAEDSPGNTSTVLQVSVGGIDDGIDSFFDQVPLDNLDASTSWQLKLAKDDIYGILLPVCSLPDCTFSTCLRQRAARSFARSRNIVFPRTWIVITATVVHTGADCYNHIIILKSR
jgi:hypothetical protein